MLDAELEFMEKFASGSIPQNLKNTLEQYLRSEVVLKRCALLEGANNVSCDADRAV